ncbi:MAG: OmpA family protein [Pseudomonadales bacterium]|nr:OmpA family protein [Pseudomonadales bacterium]
MVIKKRLDGLNKSRSFVKVFILLISAFLLSSCMTYDPYTGEQKVSNTTKGAGIGAVTGAVIGAATSSKKDREKGALTGALVGGAIGGGVGNYMDRQEARLRQQLQGSGVQVQRQGDNIRLIMPGNITFAVNRYEIRSDFYNVLDSVGLVLQEFNKTSIKVSGHTDSTGSYETNQTLSEKRAESVKQYLQSRGVVAGRIQAYGYASRYPVASNDTAYGREQNRRVELELVPMQ